jgi:hypothetical protein
VVVGWSTGFVAVGHISLLVAAWIKEAGAKEAEEHIRSAGAMHCVLGVWPAIAGLHLYFEPGGGGIALVMAAVCVSLVSVGIGLFKLHSWVRRPATMLSVVGLLVFPLGTVYWSLLLYRLHSQTGRMVLSREHIPREEAGSQLLTMFLSILLATNGLLAILLAARWLGFGPGS